MSIIANRNDYDLVDQRLVFHEGKKGLILNGMHRKLAFETVCNGEAELPDGVQKFYWLCNVYDGMFFHSKHVCNF